MPAAPLLPRVDPVARVPVLILFPARAVQLPLPHVRHLEGDGTERALAGGESVRGARSGAASGSVASS